LIWQKDGFLISDTGYTNKKLTRNHNTLLINNSGQLGEGNLWLNDADFNNRIFSEKAGLSKEAIYTDENITVVSADAKEFYHEQAGIEQFLRTVVWIKEVGFIVFDHVRT